MTLAWGEFYALVPLADLKDATTVSDESHGQYPDALWFHHGRAAIDNSRAQLIAHSTPPRRVLEHLTAWGFTRCRISVAARGDTVLVSLPGVAKPLEVAPELVFRGDDYRKELERRAGKPPELTHEEAKTHTLLTADDAPGYAERAREYVLRRGHGNLDMLLGILDGEPCIATVAKPHIRKALRQRQRQEVQHVRPVPNTLEQLIKWVHTPRKKSPRGSVLPSVEQVSGRVLPEGRVRLTARIAPDGRAMLSCRSKNAVRLTGKVSTPPLPWEERTFVIQEPTQEERNREVQLDRPTAWDLAQELLAMCGDIDLDFHRSACAVAAETLHTGRFSISVTALHRLRGGEHDVNARDYARYSRHLEIMQHLEMEVELPGNKLLLIPFVSTGSRIVDAKTRATEAVHFHAVGDSIVGMMLAEGGHRWQYLLDTRVTQIDDDFAYTLHNVLARQWSARMTINAVEGHQSRHSRNLDTVLDGTSLREVWRKRMAKQGKPWLRKRVDDAIAALNGVGLFGAAGSARVEWNQDDIAASKVLFGEPPAHILEAHFDRSSKRIAGGQKRRKHLLEKETGRPHKKGKKTAQEGEKDRT